MEINNKYGYVRVSSKIQKSNFFIESQKQQLIQNRIEKKNIFVGVESYANKIKNRSVFQKLKKNDLLMITKINRCSRNTFEFLKLQDILLKKNITFVALLNLATNKLTAITLSVMAEFENNRRKEHQKEGIQVV